MNIYMEKKNGAGIMKKLLSAALAAAMLISFSACSGGGDIGRVTTAKTERTTAGDLTGGPVTDNITVVTTAKEATTAAPVTEPTPKKLSDIYPTFEEKPNVYDLSAILTEPADTEKYGRIDAAVLNGNLLIASTIKYTYSEEESECADCIEYTFERKIFAARIDLGKITASVDFAHEYIKFSPLGDGITAVVCDDGAVCLFDENLNITASYQSTDSVASISVDEKGRVWEADYREDEPYLLRCIDIATGKKSNYALDGYTYAEYITSDGDIRYFAFMDDSYEYKVGYLDEKSGETGVLNLFSSLSVCGKMAVKNGGEKWTLGVVGKDIKVARFSKHDEYEYANCQTGGRFVSSASISNDNYGCEIVMRIYDISTGDVLAKLGSLQIGAATADPVYFGDDGRILIICYQENDDGDSMTSLAMWDSADESGTAEKCTDYSIMGEDSEEIRAAASAIEEKYGIYVYSDELSLDGAFSDYECKHIEDKLQILDGIDLLDDCLSKYPDGFFSDICRGTIYDRIEIYLTCGFTPLDTYGIDKAIALTATRGSSIIMAFDMEYSYMLGQNLAHEFMHTMEYNIADYLLRRGTNIDDYWNAANPEGFEYLYSYHDENGEEASDTTYTTIDDETTAYFYDAYSKTFPSEDRARIFEYLYKGEPYVYESPYLRAKADRLTALIRATFPSVSAAEDLCWESFTGKCNINDYIVVSDAVG